LYNISLLTQHKNYSTNKIWGLYHISLIAMDSKMSIFAKLFWTIKTMWKNLDYGLCLLPIQMIK
jgi:hypothetical protein